MQTENKIKPSDAKRIANLWLNNEYHWTSVYDVSREDRSPNALILKAISDYLAVKDIAELSYEKIMSDAAERFKAFGNDAAAERIYNQIRPEVDAAEGVDLSSEEVYSNVQRARLAMFGPKVESRLVIS